MTIWQYDNMTIIWQYDNMTIWKKIRWHQNNMTTRQYDNKTRWKLENIKTRQYDS